MGAGRVVAVGRNIAALKSLRAAFGPRVIAAAVTGDTAKDLAIIRDAAGGAADVALDILGSAKSTSTTLSTLRALKRGGRLVIMGSAEVPLEVSFREMLANDWEIVGKFMYERQAPGQLAALVASGLLDLTNIRVKAFKLTELISLRLWGCWPRLVISPAFKIRASSMGYLGLVPTENSTATRSIEAASPKPVMGGVWVPPSPLHDPSVQDLHDKSRGDAKPCAVCLLGTSEWDGPAVLLPRQR